MTARKNFTNYWQLDPGFLSQLTGNSDKLEAQGPIMAKAGPIWKKITILVLMMTWQIFCQG